MSGAPLRAAYRHFLRIPTRWVDSDSYAHVNNVVYSIGLFREPGTTAVAAGRFFHVWVDRATRKPVGIPSHVRAALAPLVTGE